MRETTPMGKTREEKPRINCTAQFTNPEHRRALKILQPEVWSTETYMFYYVLPNLIWKFLQTVQAVAEEFNYLGSIVKNDQNVET